MGRTYKDHRGDRYRAPGHAGPNSHRWDALRNGSAPRTRAEEIWLENQRRKLARERGDLLVGCGDFYRPNQSRGRSEHCQDSGRRSDQDYPQARTHSTTEYMLRPHSPIVENRKRRDRSWEGGGKRVKLQEEPTNSERKSADHRDDNSRAPASPKLLHASAPHGRNAKFFNSQHSTLHDADGPKLPATAISAAANPSGLDASPNARQQWE